MPRISMPSRRCSWITIAAAIGPVWLVGSLPAQQVVVKPYVQPGPAGSPGRADGIVICWLTDQTPGEFVVEFGPPDGPTRSAGPERVALDFAPPTIAEKPGSTPPEGEQHYFKYIARLTDLPYDAEVRYRVKLGDTTIREATTHTRATVGRPVRFVLVGDMANGKASQREIAHRIGAESPKFLVALGDLVYPAGRVSQYLQSFWATYNDVNAADPKAGAPLMASVPFYPVVGNHDVAARFPAVPDALGVFYFFHPPRSGPGEGPWNTPLGPDVAASSRFRAAAAHSYPFLDAYSFDEGPAHVVVLNSNRSGSVHEPKLRRWIEADLKGSKAPWKFVCYHAPAFHSSSQHYTEQAMRLWHPLFEACGVDIVFAGHVHNYQRTVPLRFVPGSLKRDSRGRADGSFKLDRSFDGETNTRPDGVIHVVAGGGGATLYGPGLEKTAPALKKEHGDNYADFTARLIADRHSFAVVDLTPDRLTLRGVDASGETIDRVVLTRKPTARDRD